MYTATGELVCPRSSVTVEKWGDPATDANCAAYGCAAGRSCASTSDCANGLSCRNSVSTKFNPFTTTNLDEERLEGPVSGAGAADIARRARKESEYRLEVQQTKRRPQEDDNSPQFSQDLETGDGIGGEPQQSSIMCSIM